MIQIIPAVLPTTEEGYQADIAKLSSYDSLKDGWVHIDFMDNKFVPNQSIGAQEVKKYPNDLQKEAHLMVVHPKEWVDKLADSGFKRVLFHIECEDDIDEVIDYIKAKGMQVGLVLKNDTPLEKLEPFAQKLDVIMLMGVEPGFQGQPFIPEVIEKLKKLKSKSYPARAGIDGAVRDTNIKEIVDAGANFVIMGSYLLKGNSEENLETVWEIIHG